MELEMAAVQPWFDAIRYAWIPGTLFGCLAGIWGSVVGVMAPRGKGKSIVLGAGWALAGIAVVFLAAGVTAWLSGQPYGIWYGLLLPGVIGSVIFFAQAPMVKRVYEEAEMRRMQAHDI